MQTLGGHDDAFSCIMIPVSYLKVKSFPTRRHSVQPSPAAEHPPNLSLNIESISLHTWCSLQVCQCADSQHRVTAAVCVSVLLVLRGCSDNRNAHQATPQARGIQTSTMARHQTHKRQSANGILWNSITTLPSELASCDQVSLSWSGGVPPYALTGRWYESREAYSDDTAREWIIADGLQVNQYTWTGESLSLFLLVQSASMGSSCI